MSITHTYESGNLVLLADEETQAQLFIDRAENGDFQSDDYMGDMLESVVCNSDLEWVRPEEIGALTDAPILGIRGDPRPLRDGENSDYLFLAGHWDGQTWVQDVIVAYAFMDYQIVSIQDVLADYGRAILICGYDARPEAQTTREA